MRSTACLMLLVTALLAAGCDRHSASQGQDNGAGPDKALEQDNGTGVATASAPAAGKIDRSHKGQAAPVLAFSDPAGKRITLGAFKGKPVLLNLWATWCAPCVKELPTLDALAFGRAELRVVTLSQDMDPAKVAPFFAQRRFRALKPYTDPDMAWVPAVAANLPTSILYDASGHELWRVTGDLDWTGEEAKRALTVVG